MTDPDPIVEGCLREFGTEIDLDDFIDGEVQPSRDLILYRGPRPEDQPMLIEASPTLAEYLASRRLMQ